MSSFNIEEYFNSLPENIGTINVPNKKLTYIPSLKRFTNLTTLLCECNNLTQLPELNSSLRILSCNNNQLTQLPELNSSLRILNCSNNQLTQLPELSSLRGLNCCNNELPFKLIYKGQLTDTKRNELNYGIQILKRFKELYMLIKFKKHFRNWLWIKVRLPKIQIQFHPDNLKKLISSINEEELDGALNNW
jgi:Leucine-rich repeat (LRR) protein